MQCLQPIYVKNKGYSGCVPCGSCPACRSRRSAQWSFRLEQEVRHSSGCLFLTLTYNDDCVPHEKFVDSETGEIFDKLVVCKDDIQKFIHDLRKRLYGDCGGSLRYFACSEYGPTTFRPHYHLILFNFPDIATKNVSKVIEETWRKGFVQVSPVNRNRIHYVCKYCLTDAFVHYLPVFNLMSQGIGRDWLTPAILFSYRHNPRFYTVDQYGIKRSLHRYYLEKLWPNRFQRAIIKQRLINELYETQERNNFASGVSHSSDSFGIAYQIDRYEGTLGEVRKVPEYAFGPVGEFLSNFYGKLKKSKFAI